MGFEDDDDDVVEPFAYWLDDPDPGPYYSVSERNVQDGSIDPSAKHADGYFLAIDDSDEVCPRCGGDRRGDPEFEDDVCAGCDRLARHREVVQELRASDGLDPEVTEKVAQSRPLAELALQRVRARGITPPTSGRAAQVALALRRHRELRKAIGERFRRRGI